MKRSGRLHVGDSPGRARDLELTGEGLARLGGARGRADLGDRRGADRQGEGPRPGVTGAVGVGARGFVGSRGERARRRHNAARGDLDPTRGPGWGRSGDEGDRSGLTRRRQRVGERRAAGKCRRVCERCGLGDRRGRRRGENRAAHSHLFARTVVRAAGVAGITGVGRVPLVGAVDRASRRRVTGRCGVRAVPVHRRRFGVDDGVTRVVEGEGYRPRRVVAAQQGGRVLQGCRRRAEVDRG